MALYIMSLRSDATALISHSRAIFGMTIFLTYYTVFTMYRIVFTQHYDLKRKTSCQSPRSQIIFKPGQDRRRNPAIWKTEDSSQLHCFCVKCFLLAATTIKPRPVQTKRYSTSNGYRRCCFFYSKRF